MNTYRQTPTSPSILLFCLFVFLLVTAPRAGIKVGPIPLYVIDLVIISLLAKTSTFQKLFRDRPIFSVSIFIWFGFVISSELTGMFIFENHIETVYMIGRIILSLSIFFIAFNAINEIRDLEFVLIAVSVGLIISSVLMIMSSLPFTRSLVLNLVFSNSFLEPAAAQSSRFLTEGDTGIRGRTLVGVSIIAASFINICWPLAALLWRWPWNTGAWKYVGLMACVLAPMAVLMSYSRGPIVGTILMVVVTLTIGLRRVKTGVLFPVIAGFVVVLFVGASSQLFFFDRLTNRTEAMFDAPFEDKRESERTLAYFEPWHHMLENPRFILLGEGISVRFSSSARVMPEQAGQATHAAFAMGYYAYGLTASILFLSMFVRGGLHVQQMKDQFRNSAAALLAPALILSMVGMAPWLVFGHAAISTPRGIMLFFLILGLIASLAKLQNLRWDQASKGTV